MKTHTRRFHQSPVLLFLSVLVLLGGCGPEPDEYGIVGPLLQSEHALSSAGTGKAGLPASVQGANTEVWAVSNNWADTQTPDARAAGLAWEADSGLNWEQKYNLWIEGLEETARTGTSYGTTFEITTPQGKALDVPALECAELLLMMRAVFASWYGLPFFLEARDSDGTRVFLGHFGFRTAQGRYKNTPKYRTAYNDYSHLSTADALASWPQDARLRGRHLYKRGGNHDDYNPFLHEDAGAGWYFDELLLNKRVGHFLLMLLPYFGSANLADDANAYHATPNSLRAGDILLKRWQRRGIGHVMLVKTVQQRPHDKIAAQVASGSMPRRQAVWESQASTKLLFTNDKTGGEGENNDGERYVDLGGGLKRFLVAELSGGSWRNRVLPADMDTWLPWSDTVGRAARPRQFGELLVEVSPAELRDELLAIIESKREHLRNYPASCSARTAREAAFKELYNLMQDRFQMTIDEIDGQYRLLEDYVFAELVYNQSKTCCWNSTTSAMFDVIMSYNLRLQEDAESCTQPTVFMAQDGGYEAFAEHAAEIGLGNQWVAWNDDESCPQGGVLNDTEERHGWTPYCEVVETINGDGPTEIEGDPCEDRNDSMDEATELDAGVYTGLAICRGEDDWFRIHATVGAGTLEIDFNDNGGALVMELYRSNGERIAISTGEPGHQFIESGVGVRYLRVFGPGDSITSYRLTISDD